MMLNKTKIALGAAVLGLSGCIEGASFQGTRAYRGPNDFIAIAGDLGRDSGSNQNDNAAIATTPDGCQQWYIDDGIEARASTRLDPVSGLPVCGSPPGIVFGPYQSGTQGIADRVPGDPAPTRTEMVPVRSTQGHAHPARQVHPPRH